MTSAADEEPLREQILDARARALAARSASREDAAPTTRILAFKVDLDVYGLPIEAVLRVAPFASRAPAPNGRPGLAGLTRIQGQLYNVLETSLLLNGASALDPHGGHLILLRTPVPHFALRCSYAVGVVDVVLLNGADISNRARRAVTAYGRTAAGLDELGDTPIALLDLDQLLAAFQPNKQGLPA